MIGLFLYSPRERGCAPDVKLNGGEACVFPV